MYVLNVIWDPMYVLNVIWDPMYVFNVIWDPMYELNVIWDPIYVLNVIWDPTYVLNVFWEPAEAPISKTWAEPKTFDLLTNPLRKAPRISPSCRTPLGWAHKQNKVHCLRVRIKCPAQCMY